MVSMSITVSIENNSEPTFEKNFSNQNFSMVWSALGLNVEDYEIHGTRLLDVVRNARSDLMIRVTDHDGNYTNIGIDEERIRHYLGVLMLIALESCLREELVVWG